MRTGFFRRLFGASASTAESRAIFTSEAVSLGECAACGTAVQIDTLLQLHSIMSVADVERFFRLSPRPARCPACRQPLEHSTIHAVALPDGSAINVATSLVSEWIAPIQAALGRALSGAADYEEIRGYRSLELLQQATSAELDRIARSFADFFGRETSAEELAARPELWRAGVLGAAIAVFSGKVPGASVGAVPYDEPPDARRSELVQLYGALLSGVCNAFNSSELGRLPLDRLLAEHVDGLPNEAAELVDLLKTRRKAFEELLRDESVDMTSTVAAALLVPWRLVEAALCARFSRPYPDQLKLAAEFASIQMSQEGEIQARLQVSPDRMRHFVSAKYATMNLYAYWLIVEEYFALNSPAMHERETARIQRAAAAFGRPEAAESNFRSTVLSPRPGIAPEEFADNVARMVAAAPGEQMLDVLEAGTKLAYDEGDAHHLVLVGKALQNVELIPSARADALVSLCVRLRALNAPHDALALLGGEAAQWEKSLSDELTAVIELERSRVLHATGSLEGAWDSMLKATASADAAMSSRWHVASAVQHGVLLHATGRSPEARRVLEGAVAHAEGDQRAPALRGLATVLASLGMSARAADAMAQAREVRGAVMSRTALWGDLVAEIAYRFNAGQVECAQRLMRELPPPEELPPDLLTTILPLFYMADAHDPSAGFKETVRAVIDRSLNEAEALAVKGASRAARTLRRAVLSLIHRISPERRWEVVSTLEADGTTEPEADVALFALEGACLGGDLEAIKNALVDWRLALARDHGGAGRSVEELDSAAALSQMFEESFARIWTESSCPTTVLQILNDTQRNVLQRARWLRQSLARAERHEAIETFQTTIPKQACRFVKMGLAPFAVLEWLAAPIGLVSLLTRVDSEDLDYIFPSGLNLDVVRMADELAFELSTLTPTLSGPAFQSGEWARIRAWMESILKEALPDGGHLVIIDQAGLFGLPLHVAVPPGWTTSYAADWTAVVEAARQGAEARRPETGRLALTHVLGASEAARTANAVAASDARLKLAADAVGWTTEYLGGSNADAVAICAQLERVDAIRLIAHGFVLSSTKEVALIVAADGRLPPRSGGAFDAIGMARYRLGFDRLAALERAPKLLFLGACSAGRVSERGRQERLGLFLPLSAIGTETMIMPRWPIHAPSTLPLLDRIVELYLSGVAPARAVSDVAAAATRDGAVDWIAQSFCVEGRWS